MVEGVGLLELSNQVVDIAVEGSILLPRSLKLASEFMLALSYVVFELDGVLLGNEELLFESLDLDARVVESRVVVVFLWLFRGRAGSAIRNAAGSVFQGSVGTGSGLLLQLLFVLGNLGLQFGLALLCGLEFAVQGVDEMIVCHLV